MFKTVPNENKVPTQQRTILKPMKNTLCYEEEDEDYEDKDSFLDDNSSSCYSSGAATTKNTRNDTMMLAQFLASTGPDEYEKSGDKKKPQQVNRASRLLKRLRKRPTMSVLRIDQTPETNAVIKEKKSHIPLPVYEPIDEDEPHDERSSIKQDMKLPSSSCSPSNNQQSSISVSRDSGIYSETNSERESYIASAYESVPPLPPFTSMLSDIQFPHPPQQWKIRSDLGPRRPAPLPPSITTKATASPDAATSISGSIRSVPEAVLRRRSVRIRHVQVQTSTETDESFLQKREEFMAEGKQCCPHCHQVIKKDVRNRRTSCPPVLASGLSLPSVKSTEDSKVLLAMIMKLKSQLEEEKLCRLKLEKAMHQQQRASDERREQLLKEKTKWADSCSWLDDRLAYLPQ